MPPSAQFSAVGTSGLGGALTTQSVSCSVPSVDGPGIVVFAAAAATGVSIHITIQSGKVTVTADSGSGAQFVARTFTGAGVTGFAEAQGAQLNGALTETASGSPPGKIGSITSLSGIVSCNNQQPGGSTVTLTGGTASGALSGAITPVNVHCNGAAGALTIGLTNAGTTPELVDLFGGILSGSGYVSLLLIPKGSTTDQHFTASGMTVATVSATGVHFNADLVEDHAAGVTPHTVHVSGDVTCGSSVTP